MLHIVFLFILALIWIVFAVVQDLRKKEIANWLNFSLIAFALGFRFFYSLFSNEGFGFFYQGLIGLAIFALLGNLFYYGRGFAGGDAKLMIALGTVLPISNRFLVNLEFFSVFLIVFLFVGAAYSLLTSLVLSLNNFSAFKREFPIQMRKVKKFLVPTVSVAILFLIIGFFYNIFLFVGIVLFVLPYFYVYAKAVDEACMIKKVNPKELTEGDWLYKDVRVGKKMIKASWHGLSKEEIRLLRKKNKQVMIRYGVPFSPVFLISFLALIILLTTGFWQNII